MQIAALDLGNCGLACREWLPCSRRLLFRSVRLTPQNSTNFIQPLSQRHLVTILYFIEQVEFEKQANSDGDAPSTTAADLQMMWTMPPSALLKTLIFGTPRHSHLTPHIAQYPTLQSIATLSFAYGLQRELSLSDLTLCIGSFQPCNPCESTSEES
jgi:hypothetical protein